MSEARRMKRRILVTGAAGFIGSHLVDRLLADGHVVWGLDNFDSFYSRRLKESNLEDALDHPSFELVEGDLRDDMLLNTLFPEGDFDVVLHMAAKAGVRPSIQSPDEYYDSNVTGTVTLLEAMRRFGVNSLVFASSSSVYGSRTTGPFSEDDRVDRPVSPYAATKLAGELLCHTYHHLHELSCHCLRFFTVYGPRQRPDLAIHKFARAIAMGYPVPVYGDGTARRDFTYIDDTVDGVLSAMARVLEPQKSPAFEIINLGSDRSISVLELIEMLGETMEAVPAIEHQAPQPGDVPHTWADLTRARELLGYQPKVTFEEGLRRFVAWFWAMQEVRSTAAETQVAS